MRSISQIVCKAIVLAGGAAVLVACGQKGALYLPTDPAGANRATLPETMNPRANPPEPVIEPVSPASSNQKQ